MGTDKVDMIKKELDLVTDAMTPDVAYFFSNPSIDKFTKEKALD